MSAFYPGQNINITWNSVDVYYVNVDVSYNNGGSWSRIATNVEIDDPTTEAQRSYPWLVSDQLTNELLFKITDADDGSIVDQSENAHIISNIARLLDTTNLVFGFWPAVLKNGGNPAAFNSGYFPLYRGPSAAGTENVQLTNMASGYGYTREGFCSLDRSNDLGLSNYTPQYTNTSKFTVSGWVYFNGSGGNGQAIFGIYDDNNNYIILRINDGSVTGKLEVVFNANGVGTIYTRATNPLSAGWHYIACRKDGNTFKLSVDENVSVAYDYQQSYAFGNKTFTNPISIGAATSVNHFGGLIAWLNYYDDAISDARISNGYNLGMWLGGIRGYSDAPGTDQLFDSVADPIDERGTLPTGSAWKFTGATYAIPVRHRKEFTGANQTFIPLPINIGKVMADDATFKGLCAADGSNIVPTKTDGTELPCYISNFSKTNNTGLLEIKLPAVNTSTDQEILLQIGTSTARTLASATAYQDTFGGSVDFVTNHAFDESSGDAIDAAGNYNGTLANVTQGATGKLEKAYSFNGNNSNVNLGDVIQLNSATAFTITMWFRQNAIGVVDYFFNKRPATDKAIYCNTDTNNYFYVATFKTTFDYARISNYHNYYPIKKYNMLAIVYNGAGATNADKLKVIANGIELTLDFFGTIPASIADLAGDPFVIGNIATAFDGEIDRVKIIPAALSLTDICTLCDCEHTYTVNSAWDVGAATKIPSSVKSNQMAVGVYVGL